MATQARTTPSTRPHPESPRVRGWQQSPLVSRFSDQDRAQRESALTAAFAVVAAVWAPLGVVAFVGGWMDLFLLATLGVSVLALAPRPALPAGATDAVGARASALRDRAASLVSDLRERAEPALAALWDRAAAAAVALRARGRAAVRDARPSRWIEGQSTPSSTR